MAHPDFYYESHFPDDLSYHDSFLGFPSEAYPTPSEQQFKPEADLSSNNTDYMSMAVGGVDYNYYYADSGVNDIKDEYMTIQQTGDFYFPENNYSEVQSTPVYFETPLVQQEIKSEEFISIYDGSIINDTDLIVNDGRLYKKPVNGYIPMPVAQANPPVTEEIEPPPILEFHGLAPPSNTTPNEVEELAEVQKKVLQKYISKFQKNIDNNSFRSRAKYYDILSVDDLYTRLEKLKCCDPADRRCTYHTCGRRFINLEVLAFHVGYAHQAVKNSSTCTVCGMTCRNSKGKLAHMLTAHKDLARKHQHVCMVQAPKFMLTNSNSTPEVITVPE